MTLFDTPYTVQVALDVPLDRCFDYTTSAALAIGQRVVVPFGPRQLCGVVMGPGSLEPPVKLRPIQTVLDDLPPLPTAWLDLVKFASDYYLYPLGATLFTALPTRLRQPKAWQAKTDPIYRLTEAGKLSAHCSTRAPRQQALLDVLRQQPLSLSHAKQHYPTAAKLLEKWQGQGWVSVVDTATGETPPLVIGPQPTLTTAQTDVVQALQQTATGFSVTLLHGITGSGKTEVYLRRIAEVLAQGKQVLVLVPEISLTPQLEARFRHRFPHTPMVSLHSQLAEGERAQAWVAAWQHQAQLVIGTRLAVFTPLPALGLIIIDEEHDSSFKQQEGLRYSARDLAVWRARQTQIPIVLGSATPSLETLANVQSGRYRYLALNQRASGAPLPNVQLVDIRQQPLDAGLSPPALAAINHRLQQGQLSLVYVNRRGYAPALACGECGWLAACPCCSARLVWHKPQQRLRCHHCGHQQQIPPACPSCGNVDLRPLGQGTQRLEEALQQHFPHARIARIDRDTMQRKSGWDALLGKIARHELDILVGTQMLAKGHDFPALSLVVVLNADGALYSASYRASETLFAELTQVAGRAGRADKRGEVLIQTQLPQDRLYQALVKHDFQGYTQHLLQERQQLGWPPYCYQALLRADAPQLATALAFLEQIYQDWHTQGEVYLFPPQPAAMTRLANRERAHLLWQAEHRNPLRAVMQALRPHLAQYARAYGHGLRWSLEIDPWEA